MPARLLPAALPALFALLPAALAAGPPDPPDPPEPAAPEPAAPEPAPDVDADPLEADPLDGLAPAEAVAYAPPVDAAVADPFRAPEHPYGPGNRGLEYATVGGEAVRAAASGVVTFAGPVGPDRFVTVLHADRVRTTYGRLASVEVVAGQRVAAGERVGRAGPELIWTARLGEAYLDPAVLLAASGTRRAWLVADGTPPP